MIPIIWIYDHIKKAQFIFTGAGWNGHVDASSSGGGRRRLMKASHEDYDGFSKQKSIEKLKAFQEIDNVPSMDYFQVDSNNIFLRRTKGSKIVLPQASGSGHVIRLYIQNDVQLDKKHTIIANYPIFGRFRYVMEELRPKILAKR